MTLARERTIEMAMHQTATARPCARASLASLPRTSTGFNFLRSLGQAPPFRTLSCSKTILSAPELARLQDCRVDLDRKRTAEELHEHLHAGRCVELTLEDGVDHPERPALNDDMLTVGEPLSRLLEGAVAEAPTK